MIDIMVYETGSGGDVLIRNNDIVMSFGEENVPYLSHFGGREWWGDDLLVFGNQRHLATTEKVINTVPLTSNGRVKIEEAMNKDLDYLAEEIPGTKSKVSVAINNSNKISADVEVNGQTFFMNWNPDSLYLSYALT